MCPALKAVIRWTFPIIIAVFFVTSCTIQKRLFNKGYSIEWRRKFKSDHNYNDEKTDFKEQMLSSDSGSISITDPVPVLSVPELTPDSIVAHISQNPEISVSQKKPQLLQSFSKNFHVQIIREKKKPKPPNETVHKLGTESIKEAFSLIEICTLFFFIILVLILIINVLTVAVLQDIFMVLLIISISCFTTFFGYIFVFAIIGGLCLFIYWITKMIYKRKLRTWNDLNPSEISS